MNRSRLFAFSLICAIFLFATFAFAQEEGEDYSVREWDSQDLGEKEQKRRPQFNYLEEKLPDFKLPELLVGLDGKKVRTAKDWSEKRRGEILGLFETYVYGKAPGRPEGMTFEVFDDAPSALGGIARRKQVTVNFTGKPDGPTMDILIYLPKKKKKKVPTFLLLNFQGNHAITTESEVRLSTSWMRSSGKGVVDNKATEASRGAAASRFPIEEILKRGYALATIYYGDIDPDFHDEFKNGVHGVFDGPGERSPDAWGSVAAWAWGLGRAMDYFETDEAIDHTRVAVLGHSRLGKTALWAGATDERFAIVISNDSGCGGAALSRRRFGESVERINTSFPHWFCENFKKYNANEGACPVDQHMLIALAAPRPVYVASAERDLWSDPRGEFLSALNASPVYELFGKRGIDSDEMPALNQPVGDSIGYHIRSGGHNLSEYDWQRYMDFADYHYGAKKRKNSDKRINTTVNAGYPFTPVPFTEVKFDDSFWTPRIEINRTVTVPYAFEKCEETKRIDNFAIAGGLQEGKFVGIHFNDSDVFKVIEGAAYVLTVKPDPELDKYLDDLIAKIAAAQEDDGYLYTMRTISTPGKLPPGGKERWSNIAHGHELYNVGHMYEAAVAHHRATGKRSLLDVAVKNADLVCRVFGPGKRTDPPGHQEIEIGLAKLYTETGNKKYLDMAKFFLDARGHLGNRERLYGDYSQDHKPVIEQDHALGHAVRASYMYTGMADIAALTGDRDYVQAIDRIWTDVVDTKLYITGGVGAAGEHEGFGPPYDLPNRVAYCETCASIANVMWNHRLFLMHGDGKYIDVMERTLYNALLSGVSLEGNLFFYPNRLESIAGDTRAPWFGCACCPSNIARFIASVPGYAYAHQGDRLYVNLFVAGKALVPVADTHVTIRQETRYPWDGGVRISIDPDDQGRVFTLNLRVPGWARDSVLPSDLYKYQKKKAQKITLKINAKKQNVSVRKGYVAITREWNSGDRLELSLPMSVRRVISHEKILQNTGKTSLERGPIVFCVEGADMPEGHVLNLLLPDDEEIQSEFRGDLLGGVQVLTSKARSYHRTVEGQVVPGKTVPLTAIPYYAWAHREKGEMAVWLARMPEAVSPLPAPTLANTSRATASKGAKGDLSILADQREPQGPADHGSPRVHWWPKKATTEWLQYDFAREETVSEVEVYWFDDTGRGACRAPASWRLLYHDGQDWKPVANPSNYGTKIHQYNKTTFAPIKTDGLKLEVELPEKFSAGIHEWRVK